MKKLLLYSPKKAVIITTIFLALTKLYAISTEEAQQTARDAFVESGIGVANPNSSFVVNTPGGAVEVDAYTNNDFSSLPLNYDCVTAECGEDPAQATQDSINIAAIAGVYKNFLENGDNGYGIMTINEFQDHVTDWIEDNVITTGIEEIVGQEEGASAMNYPNPFNLETTLKYSVPKRGKVSITIYDIKGRKIKDLVHKQSKTAGNYEAIWDGKDTNGNEVASGTYFYNLVADGKKIEIKKCIMLK
ncbi:MAG: T9SS type A sorting domain-containing protein [FCB group bacterium]|nr:T9SS type A sorting domain-containing protein [FCB group bacterium]